MPKKSKSRTMPKGPVPRFQGIIVHIGEQGSDPVVAEGVLRRLANERLPGSWRVSRLGAQSLDYLLAQDQVRKQVTPGTAWEWTMRFRRSREVFDAEPAFEIPGLTPDDQRTHWIRGTPRLAGSRVAFLVDLPESQDCEWSLKHCQVPQAWAYSQSAGTPTQGAGVIIGHPDTGYTQHPEISAGGHLNAAAGYNFYDGIKDPLDDLNGSYPGHGTSTASVIMSTQGVGAVRKTVFVTGTAPGTSLIPLRVSDSVIHYSFANLTAAIYYAVDQGCHIVSMSLGGPFSSSALQRAIQHAVANDVILLAAAGNVWPYVVYPAKYPEVIAITACNVHDEIWADAATGDAVDATAPGESVWRARTDPGPQYQIDRSSGTSYAVAIAAGICALWLAHHGHQNLIDRYGRGNVAGLFKEILITHGVRTPTNWKLNEWGAGIVNAESLLRAPLPGTARLSGIARVHASAVARSKSDFDEVAEYFPDMDPDPIRRVLIKLFKTNERGLNVLLAEIGDELRFHLATDKSLRASIGKQAGVRLTKTTPTLTPSKSLIAVGSLTLKRHLQTR